MSLRRMAASIGVASAAIIALGACGGGADAKDQISVNTSDDTCDVAKTKLSAGTQTFKIKSTASKVTEFEVLRPDGQIVSERENIGPNTTVTFTVDLKAGSYQAACIPGQVGKGIRTKLEVTGEAAGKKRDPRLDKAVDSYRTYVNAQVADSLGVTRKFVAAVKAGDVEKAKSLYAKSRYGWESIEPVAESFGNIDPKVDLREADLVKGQKWTGWHVIEKSLWQKNTTKGMAAYGDQLIKDLTTLQEKVGKVEITPASMGNGAKELLDEVATGKVTGEEEAFSHTDLTDFEANVVGAKKAYTLMRPVVKERDKALAATLDKQFASVLGALEKYEKGDGYVSYDTVGEADRKALSDKVNALAEPLSKLAAVVAR